MSLTQNLNHFIPKKLVLIGASTGGPIQIERIVKSISKLENTSFIIAQHMSDGFMPSYAQRLQNKHENKISVAQYNDLLESGCIYLCTGITTVSKHSYELRFNYNSSPINRYNPDINVLFNSFVPLSKDIEILSVILTGIGDDGISASVTLSLSGVRCITEDESSAIVDGMPSRARQFVPNIQIHTLDEIIEIINRFCE